MKTIQKQVVIIGGGPAGLAAAAALRDAGVRDILILEREKRLGGILNQCIHDGFGLTRFGESLSGPEYAARFVQLVSDRGIECRTDCTVLSLSGDRRVTAASREGLCVYEAGAVILAMGCRERPRGALSIPGDRPSGVWTAGVAQAYMNLDNLMVGKKAVILGSGDIGMIMARRLTLEGVQVEAVFEILPYASGLPRNVQQCLRDYGIPLYLSHTVTRINGRGRLRSVTVSQVDGEKRPIPGTEKEWECDTLILSVGLIPENELTLQAGALLDPRTGGAAVDEYGQTTVPGIFSAGNVLHVHDLVDDVSEEAERLAEGVLLFLEGKLAQSTVPVEAGDAVSYVVPQRASGQKDITLSFRCSRPMSGARFDACQGEHIVASLRVRRAIPAVMMHMEIPSDQLNSREAIKVVCHND